MQKTEPPVHARMALQVTRLKQFLTKLESDLASALGFAYAGNKNSLDSLNKCLTECTNGKSLLTVLDGIKIEVQDICIKNSKYFSENQSLLLRIQQLEKENEQLRTSVFESYKDITDDESGENNGKGTVPKTATTTDDQPTVPTNPAAGNEKTNKDDNQATNAEDPNKQQGEAQVGEAPKGGKGENDP